MEWRKKPSNFVSGWGARQPTLGGTLARPRRRHPPTTWQPKPMHASPSIGMQKKSGVERQVDTEGRKEEILGRGWKRRNGDEGETGATALRPVGGGPAGLPSLSLCLSPKLGAGMGCGGSKHDVVTGNTASRRSLVKKSSDASHCASAANVDTGGNLTADVKDIAISSADGVDVGEGKLLSHSPDRYFSSRRDDAVASDECFDSPLYVPDGDRTTAKELKDRTADGVAGSKKAAAAADDQYPGPLQDELAGDVVKEQIVAEETKFEVTG